MPVKDSDRSPILDVLRGIAILGIFINNIYGFSGYGFFTEEYKKQLSTYPIDKVISFLQTMLVEGKFYSLFSLLFGIGFSIIIIRTEAELKKITGENFLLVLKKWRGKHCY